MSALVELYFREFLVFLLVLTRIGGLVLVAPIFGPRTAPMQARAFLVVALAAIVSPLHWESGPDPPGNLVVLVIMLGREAALGLGLGMAVTIFFTGMQLAGNIMGQMSGMQLADAFDPTYDATVPVFGQLLDIIAVAVFIATSGHRKVIGALLDTFHWRPPGGDDFPTSIVEALVTVATESFLVGIRAAAPVMISLLLAVLILGLISRTLPQLNVFVIGFNINAFVALLTLSFSLATVSFVVEERADEIVESVRDALNSDAEPG